MWVNLRIVVAALAISTLASAASAAVIADYQGNFQPGSPRTGWAYLWNATGPVGDAANYVPLVPTGIQYGTAIPGNDLAVHPTVVIPGPGTTEDPAGIQRAAILAYTVSAADIAANGNVGYLDDYHFGVPLSSVDGVTPSIYVNNTPVIPIDFMVIPPGFAYDRSYPDAYPMPLGVLQPGDTIYVAIGPRFTDNADQLDIQYTIKLVPEPMALSIFGLIGAGLLARRRR